MTSPSSDSMWFYADASNQSVGPIPFSELQHLAAAGTIRSDSYVFQSGTTDWRRYVDVVSAPVAAPPPLHSTAPAPAPALVTPPPSATKPWHQRIWLIPATMLLCFPAAIVFIWINQGLKTVTKIALTAVCVLLGMIGVFSPSTPSGATESRARSSSTSSASQASQPASSLTWEEINATYSLHTRATDVAKDERWKNYKNKRVRWTGEVTEVMKAWGDTQLHIKMNSNTFSSDVILILRDDQLSKAARLSKGDHLLYEGRLKEWGSLMPITADDGVIVSP